MITPQMQANIAVWRQKALEGILSMEEMREAIKLLREDRLNALQASAGAKRKKATAIIPDADDLLKELGDL